MFSFSTIATCAFIPTETLEKFLELNIFQAKKNEDTYHIIDQIKVSFCKSQMLHFEMKGQLKLQLQFI